MVEFQERTMKALTLTVKEMKEMIKDLPDDTPIAINSVWNGDTQEFEPSACCDGFYHEGHKAVYLTPATITI